MFEKLFPSTIDNTYKGHSLGRWLLYLYILKSLFSGSVHMFAPDGSAQSIASIALDSFSEGASNTIITIFGMWGMEQFVIGLIALMVVLRYRALIPAIALVYVVEYVGRFAMTLITPGVFSEHTPPGAVADYVLVPLAFIMLFATVHQKKTV